MVRLGAVLVLALGCSRASSEGEAKQWPEPPPQRDVPIPANVEIAVTIDGAPGAAITTGTLRGAKPDFVDEERKAWRVGTLVGDARAPGTVEAVSSDGLAIRYPHPTADGLEPVLYLTRRGELSVGMVDPKDPFPRYHGQGGRLHRPGDSKPRVPSVAKLHITRTRP
ncbi:MAG: hypothetical protein KF773_24575 [Deltaproteobacteria bacterium]|nr:hypothetical protein [Deltaproteobacteria bacterium]MCW5808418.1 hypothetical protein [Deltaproteobacteria bacterium]